MIRLGIGAWLAALALAGGSARAEGARSRLDAAPRTAVMCAFPPELETLRKDLTPGRVYTVSGTRFETGILAGRPVVLFLSGVSMVNAAMTAERAAENFKLRRIVFSGIAGGVDPDLNVGDVVVPDRWTEYLESVMARETTPGAFTPPADEPLIGAHLGMIFPAKVEAADPEGRSGRQEAFNVDPQLLTLARRAGEAVTLRRCAPSGACLAATPKVRIGGAGVSGPAFVDNKELRLFLRRTFEAEVVDMESAAVAHVAYSNGLPFIAFRSLSDLAGGEPGANQASVLFQFAADNSARVVEAFLKDLPDRAPQARER